MAVAHFVACDFGAESGRLIVGSLGDESSLELKEVHRFANRQVKVLGHLHWDLLNLYSELKIGLAKAADAVDGELSGIGVDTWGVDFGLIGKDGRLLENPYTYRDARTNGMLEVAFQLVPREELYRITGIQFMQLNTLYQLLSMRRSESSVLDAAHRLLFMPDLFNYLMTGEAVSEYTIASTSQLLAAREKFWSKYLFDRLDLPIELMPSLVQPGTIIGPLLAEIQEETGLGPVPVIAPACHDTASAIVAIPAKGQNWAYLSSGTWSLLGVEAEDPIVTERSLASNFTNEGGYSGRIRFLKNNMGLWLLEHCRRKWKELGEEDSYDHLLGLAEDADAFTSTIDPDHHSFLNPADMPQAIRDFCTATGQSIPDSKGQLVRTIFESLALKYRFLVDQINAMRSERIEKLHIVGGGSRNRVLNQFTSDALGLDVIAGPVEGTATGNILVQAIASGLLENLEAARELVGKSFELEHYQPKESDIWEDRYNSVKDLFV